MESQALDFSGWTNEEVSDLVRAEPPVDLATMRLAVEELKRRHERLAEWERKLREGLEEELARDGGAGEFEESERTLETPAHSASQQEGGGEAREPAGGEEGQEKATEEKTERK